MKFLFRTFLLNINSSRHINLSVHQQRQKPVADYSIHCLLAIGKVLENSDFLLAISMNLWRFEFGCFVPISIVLKSRNGNRRTNSIRFGFKRNGFYNPKWCQVITSFF